MQEPDRGFGPRAAVREGAAVRAGGCRAMKGGGTGWLTADRCEAILVQHNREVEGNRQLGINKTLSSRIYIGHFRRYSPRR